MDGFRRQKGRGRAGNPARPRHVESAVPLGEGGLGRLDELGERGRIGDGQVGEDLAVELHLGLVEALDEAAVGDAFGADGGVDAHDPERAVVALAELAVDGGVAPGVVDGLGGGAEALAAAAVEALGELEPLAAAFAGCGCVGGTGHGVFPPGGWLWVTTGAET